jgi:hypothetical protein
MAALAPVYCLVKTAALTLKTGSYELLAAAVVFAAITALPLFFRDSRAFNGACYTAIGLLVGGLCIGGFLFLPAALPLLFATPPTLGAPIPQICVAAVLVAVIVAILSGF